MLIDHLKISHLSVEVYFLKKKKCENIISHIYIYIYIYTRTCWNTHQKFLKKKKKQKNWFKCFILFIYWHRKSIENIRYTMAWLLVFHDFHLIEFYVDKNNNISPFVCQQLNFSLYGWILAVLNLSNSFSNVL